MKIFSQASPTFDGDSHRKQKETFLVFQHHHQRRKCRCLHCLFLLHHSLTLPAPFLQAKCILKMRIAWTKDERTHRCRLSVSVYVVDNLNTPTQVHSECHSWTFYLFRSHLKQFCRWLYFLLLAVLCRFSKCNENSRQLRCNVASGRYVMWL